MFAPLGFAPIDHQLGGWNVSGLQPVDNSGWRQTSVDLVPIADRPTQSQPNASTC